LEARHYSASHTWRLVITPPPTPGGSSLLRLPHLEARFVEAHRALRGSKATQARTTAPYVATAAGRPRSAASAVLAPTLHAATARHRVSAPGPPRAAQKRISPLPTSPSPTPTAP